MCSQKLFWQFATVQLVHYPCYIFILAVSKQPETKGLNRLEVDEHTHTHTLQNFTQ